MSGSKRSAGPAPIALAVICLSAVATTSLPLEANAEGELNVYNWSDYIGETTVEDFQKATGITVR